jgi:plastocyanin
MPSKSSATAASMAIKNFAYHVSGTVRPGSPIKVHNDDGTAHTVTVANTRIDVTVPGSGTTTFSAPGRPGTYSIRCDFHGNMHARLVAR